MLSATIIMEDPTVTYTNSLLPEALWIESEYFEQARTKARHLQNESHQWRAYINSLGLSAFRSWVEENLHTDNIQPIEAEFTDIGYLNIEGFKTCVITTEHVLDETVRFLPSIVWQPELAAHLYVVLEVLEEQQQVTIRGLLCRDELLQHLNLESQHADATASEPYLLPLSLLDEEINHLLSYVQHTHPSSIPMPKAIAQVRETATSKSVTSPDMLTCLSQWLDEALTEGWQSIDRLINPEANLARSTRENTLGAKGGKLIDLGVQIDRHLIALIVTAIPEEEKVGVNIQLLPTGGDLALPPGLTVGLRSSADKVLQTVTARAHDSYIQLRPFRGKPGIRFTVEVTLDDVKVSEAFEL